MIDVPEMSYVVGDIKGILYLNNDSGDPPYFPNLDKAQEKAERLNRLSARRYPRYNPPFTPYLRRFEPVRSEPDIESPIRVLVVGYFKRMGRLDTLHGFYTNYEQAKAKAAEQNRSIAYTQYSCATSPWQVLVQSLEIAPVVPIPAQKLGQQKLMYNSKI